MLKFIKDCFKQVKIKCNEQELTGVSKVLAFVVCTIAICVILGIAAVMIIGAVAVAICLLPIALVFEGIRQIVEAVRDFREYNKKKEDIKNNYREQLKQIEEYSKNPEIVEIVESLKTSKSTVQDEKGSEVVVQELVPITLEDIENYIDFIKQFNPVEAQILEGHLKLLTEIKGRLDETVGSKERERLECEYDSIMFIVQERLNNHSEHMRNINNNFNESQKKRRLFK